MEDSLLLQNLTRLLSHEKVELFLVPSLVLLTFIPIIVIRFLGNVMYSFFVTVYIWIAMYIFLLSVLIFYIKKNNRNYSFHSPIGLVILISLTICSRFLFLGSDTSASLDPLWYLDYGQMMLSGQMPYADFYFLYPPVFGYHILLVSLFHPTIDSFRAISSIYDVGIVAVLWVINRQKEYHPFQQIIPIAYVFLPISIIESGLHGHFEPLANLLLLIGLWWTIRGRYRAGAMGIGLSAATKIYAGFLVPILLLLIPDNREKVLSVIISGLTAFLTFIPFSLPVWIRGDMVFPGMPMPGQNTGFLDSTFGFLHRIDTGQLFLFGILVISVVLLLVLLLPRLFNRIRAGSIGLYYGFTVLFSLVLISMAVVAAIYPITPIALEFLWRYPADIAIVRGLSTVMVGSLLIYSVYMRKRTSSPTSVAPREILLVFCALILLLLSLFRQAFFGWYLLWSLTPLLLLRDRRVFVLALVTILLLYPSFTHDNFSSLGYNETRDWQDPMTDISGWTSTTIVNTSEITESEIETDTSLANNTGVFLARIASGVNESELDNVQVRWSKDVSIDVQEETNFVIEMTIGWNPSFGKQAHVQLHYQGLDENGGDVNGTIISRSTILTNLSYLQWRHAFSSSPISGLSEVKRLTLVLEPIESGELSIFIREIYTVNSNIVLISPWLPVLLLVPISMSVYTLWAVIPDEMDYWEDSAKNR